MKMLKTVAATLCTLIACVGSVHAATVINSTAGLANPDTLVTFEEVPLAQNTPVSNQYAALGLTFSAGLQAHLVTVPVLNLIGQNLSNFAPVVPSFSIFFTDDVTDATFSFISNTGESTFTARLNGTTVESFSAQTSLFSSSNFVGFTNTHFDEIFVQVGGVNGAMILDNLAFNLAPAPVPVPASLPLVFGGLAAFGLMRARRRSA